jgi:hypothetical protein
MCMDKKWALENIDPYLTEALTPLSPPVSNYAHMYMYYIYICLYICICITYTYVCTYV